ncbi:TraR/DksA C4-type zinc finger protein [Pseudomonas sp. B21-056]|jgi:phage/conjugal plasmid C-4 type zinc finger TraR family protein|uniref:TraR/DksA C4-type zinc finger protein n=1 Tax=Pseudomonas sp. B21-056 TaxID=2895495 RepID=UPI00222F872D|nr:TraR/DksA C4-type zinc finger protein [Pseudomonas sp. B21-056]UZE21835.1 TraR/DksA C4-type zinc finger protein [Pseudomonas sp. B21-056]
MDVAEHATDDDISASELRVRNSALRRGSGRSVYRCEECGDAIPEDRRQAEPGTEHCLDCIDALEHLATRGFE